jgi:hypothetical protein
MLKDLGAPERGGAVEWQIILPYGLPIYRELVKGIDVQSR